MTQVEDRIIDYKKLRSIFSSNASALEQVMMGLLLTAHEKVPALKRYYANEDWDNVVQVVQFMKSAYKHIATADLIRKIENLEELANEREVSDQLQIAIDQFFKISQFMIKDIEDYLASL